LFVLSVAALCLSAELAGALHNVFVPHVVCREHGEWVHADAAVSHVSGTALGAGTTSSRVALAPGDDAEEHAHDVCFVGREHAPWVAGSDRCDSVLPSGDVALAVGFTPPVPTSHRVYEHAPKTSPPRA
jgi:hypothetical protein